MSFPASQSSKKPQFKPHSLDFRNSFHLPTTSCSNAYLLFQRILKMGGFKWHQKSVWESTDDLRYRDRETVIELLLTEFKLRELRQREEAISQRIRVAEKTRGIAHQKSTEIECLDQQLTKTQTRFATEQYKFYSQVSMLTPYLKMKWDELRRDKEWFMRQELVHDCSERGGCCSRACGCCFKRTSLKGQGLGHCTPECWCCEVSRAVELTSFQKKEIAADLAKRLREYKSAFLLSMANSFFSPAPRPKVPAFKRISKTIRLSWLRHVSSHT